MKKYVWESAAMLTSDASAYCSSAKVRPVDSYRKIQIIRVFFCILSSTLELYKFQCPFPFFISALFG